MEVHHHPHVEKKSFKEYFLEFIMIFLAVTLGFFAESLREHISDKKKEKQIILSLKSDLEKDTMRLHHLIDDYLPAFHSWIDSSHYEIDSLTLKGNERKICKALFNATFWDLYTPPAIAQSTLKDPFTFNMIKNEQVKTEMLNYDTNLNNFIMYNEFLTGLRHSIDTSFVSLVNRNDIRKLLDGLALHNYFITDNDLPDSIQFRTYDKAVFKNFLTRLDQIDFKTKDLQSFYRDLLHEDIQLLRLFRDQYHTKE